MKLPRPIQYVAMSVGIALALLEWVIFYRRRRPWLPPHARR